MNTENWDNYRIFLACLRHGSLRGGAQALGVNHATVARAISNLETVLGTKIFYRSVNGLQPSPSGQLLVQYAEEIEQQTAQIRRRIAGLDTEPSGSLRVSVPPSLAQGLIAPLLAEFSRLYPKIDVLLISTNRRSNLVLSEAEVSIRVAKTVDDDVIGRKLVNYVVGAYATPDYLAAHPDLTIGDGQGADWIGWGKTDDWVKNTAFPNATVRHRLPEIFLQLEVAAKGLGMVWVPCFLGDTFNELVRIPNVVPKPDLSIWMLLHGDLRHTARVRAFVDFYSDWVTENRNRFVS